MTPIRATLLVCTLAISLAGCGHWSPERLSRLEQRAENAVATGHTERAYRFYKTLYEQNDHAIEYALPYARTARQVGNTNASLKAITPYITTPQQTEAALAWEYAASLVTSGAFLKAKPYLISILNKGEASAPFHAQSHNLLGVIADVQGNTIEAEKHFDKALALWPQDLIPATPVYNNLGLFYAKKGHIDRALTLLRQGAMKDPEAERLAENISLLEALRDNTVPKAPLALSPKRVTR